MTSGNTIRPTRRLRRALLALTAAISLAVPLTAAAVPPSPAAGQVSPVRHVIVIMLENHSFDSVLGTWCDQTGRCTGEPASVTLSDGTVVAPSAEPDIVPMVSHSVASQAAATDGGKMDGWQQVPGCGPPAWACISSVPPADEPNVISLAAGGALAQAAFTQADSPSFGGHLNLLAGTADGFTGDNPSRARGVTPGPGWGCDSGRVAQWLPPSGALRAVPSCVPDYALDPALYPYGGAFRATPAQHVPVIMDELGAAGVTWRIYAPPRGHAGYIWAGCPSFASCLDTSQAQDMVPQGQFFADAAAGNLPGVSFVIPGAVQSEHNGQSMAAGDNWLGQVVTAAEQSTDWPSTAILVSWDDCGCFYDQVAPPVGPDGRQEGPRVPLIAVSPYAVAGYTDSTPTTSTGSILAFIESVFGLPPLGVNDAGAYNLSGMFNYAQSPRPGPRMVLRRLPARDYRTNPAAADDGT